MEAIITLLRGVNIGGHHKIKMDELRALYESLGLRDVRTCLQSGNVVFRTQARGLPPLGRRIEDAIERTFGFRCAVIQRTASELKDVVERNPFASRSGIDPAKFVVAFLAGALSKEVRERAVQIKSDTEELRVAERELYIYFRNGQGRANLSWSAVEKTLEAQGTCRNWNTVGKLVEMASTLSRQH